MGHIFLVSILFVMGKKHHKKYKKAGQRPIIIKTPQQIDNIRIAGGYLTTLLKILREEARIGIVLNDLEAKASIFIKEHKLK